MEPIVFKHENYNIASNIRLEADVAYIQGQPIVKTKTVVLHYRGSTFIASTYGSSFTNALIMHVARPQYVIELINYLSRIINHDNLFEVYAKNRNIERYTLEELTFANSENDKQGRTPLLDKTEYFEGLLDAYNRFQQDALLATMNARFSYTFPSIEELDYVPIYGYISTSGKLNGNWKAEPVLHLAVVFNVLAHQDRFSGINNQEAIASFNSIMRAKRLNVSAQSLSEHEYSNEIECLKLELQREHERANGLEIAKKTLEEKLDAMNAKLDVQTQALNEANAKLDVQTQELVQAHAQRDEIQATLNQERDANTVFRNNVNQAIVDIKHQVDERFTQASEFIDNKLSGLNLTTATTTWLFIVIKRPSLIRKLRAKHIISQHQSVYDTICCKQADKAKELKHHEYNEAEDEIVLEKPCSNALDLSHFMKRRFEPTIARCLNISGECYRKIAYMIGAENDVLSQLAHHLVTALNVKQEIAESLDGTQLATRDYIDERFNQLEAQQAQQMQAINNIAEEVHQVHEIVKTIAEMLAEVHPNANSIFHRCRYRILHREADGRVWCEDTKGGARYYLTENDINNGRFR